MLNYNMASSFLAPAITGRYDFHSMPLQLPQDLVRALLPPAWSASLSNHKPANSGHAWVVVQAGSQIQTGVSLPGGRHNFQVSQQGAHTSTSPHILIPPLPPQEAKLEIPFLKHPESSATSSTLVTYKHTLLFSSTMMSVSSKAWPGLHTAKVAFVEGAKPGDWDVKDWMKIEQVNGGVQGDGWSEDEIVAEATGWWAGERTGATAFQVRTRLPPQESFNLYASYTDDAPRRGLSTT